MFLLNFEISKSSVSNAKRGQKSNIRCFEPAFQWQRQLKRWKDVPLITGTTFPNLKRDLHQIFNTNGIKTSYYCRSKVARIIKPLVKSLAASTNKYSTLRNSRSKGMSPLVCKCNAKKAGDNWLFKCNVLGIPEGDLK